MENGRVIVSPVQKRFLKHKNTIITGKGNIEEDLQLAEKLRVERYK